MTWVLRQALREAYDTPLNDVFLNNVSAGYNTALMLSTFLSFDAFFEQVSNSPRNNLRVVGAEDIAEQMI